MGIWVLWYYQYVNSVDVCNHTFYAYSLCIQPYSLLLLISMLWHWQAIFESKGDKLSSSAECRIRTQGLRHLFASRLNACWQTDWAIEDQAKIFITMQFMYAIIIPIHPFTMFTRNTATGAIYSIFIIVQYELYHHYFLHAKPRIPGVRNRYSRLLFTSEDRLCANLRVQEQSRNMASQCQYQNFVFKT